MRKMVGKATANANNQAFNHISIIFSTNPTLNKLITKDIMQDMRSDIKNEKTTL